jgi:hypothetical protein
MDDTFNTQKLLLLRKLTRAVVDLLRGQLKEYLSTLGPLLKPQIVLGDLVAGGPKEGVRDTEKAFKDLQTAFETVAPTRPFNLPTELKRPVEISSSVLEFAPVEYTHPAKTNGETKSVAVTSPLKWSLNYTGFGPRRLHELLTAKSRSLESIQEFVLHTVLLQVVLARQPGITKILEAVHFPVSTNKRPEFGDLPLTFITSSVSTVRPPDEVIIESTEISGLNAFEEVVSVADITGLNDRLRDQLLELVKKHAAALLPTEGGG